MHDDYYPFGLIFNEYQNPDEQSQDFLYQGKELEQDLGLDIYDFEARGYDPALGRTWQLDPHLENYYDCSPYSWAGDNPILNIDPTGMDWFVNNNNGAVIYIQGSSEIDYNQLEKQIGSELMSFITGGAGSDAWENLGSDEMFDTKDNKISESAMLIMGYESSEDFMNKKWKSC